MINQITRRGQTQQENIGQVKPDVQIAKPDITGEGSFPLRGKVAKSRMRGTCGFTLIELLVVVLIIGILAAVALPQYQKAVEKSKIVEGLTLLKSVGQAASAYYLTNGTLPTSLDQLDVSLANTGEEIDSRVNGLICGMPDDVRAVSADWGVGLNFNRVFVFRLNGKYAYTETDAKVKNSHMRMYVSGNQQGKMTCVVGSSTNDYCQKIIGVHSEGEFSCPQLEYQM